MSKQARYCQRHFKLSKCGYAHPVLTNKLECLLCEVKALRAENKAYQAELGTVLKPKQIPCFHYGKDCSRLFQYKPNRWMVTCDNEDCPCNAHPTSGKTAEIAVSKWNTRKAKYDR